MLDFNAPIPPHEFRIYGDNRASVWAVVDEEDYHWAIQWLWNAKRSKRNNKIYLKRCAWIDGRRTTLYLHIEIMKRKQQRPLGGPAFKMVDHCNGDSLLNTRRNLRWATPQQNRMNIFGCYEHGFLI